MLVTKTLLTLTLAAAGVLSAPSAEIDQRQDASQIDLVFWSTDNCEGEPIGRRTITENSRVCDDPELGIANIRKVSVTRNTHTLPVRLYADVNCQQGQFLEIQAGQTVACWSQNVQSVQFGPFFQ